MPCEAMKSSSHRASSSGVVPEKYEVSRTRSYAGRGSSHSTTTRAAAVVPRAARASRKRWPTIP
jgi:hypothetical protein